MTGDRPVVPAWPLHTAVDHRELLRWVLLSLLLHVAIVVLFVEAAGDDAARSGPTDRAALTVRLRLPWQQRAADAAPPPTIEAPARRAAPGSTPAPAAEAAPGPQVLAREPLPPLEMPVMRPLDDSGARLAEPPPLPRVAAEPLARIAPLPSPLPLPEAPRLAEPPPLPRIAAELLPRIETAPVPAPVPDVPPLAEPPPSPRIDAEPLPRLASPPSPAPLPEAARLPEPPPLPRIVAEPLPKAAAPPPLAIPDVPALAEPPPLPRIDAQPLPRLASPPAARSVDATRLAEPGTAAPPAGRNPAPPLPAAATGGTPVAPAPQRLDFGPRRVVDPDLAALVGEAPADTQPPGRVDPAAIRDVARELNRAEAAGRGRRATDGGAATEPESTLGRAIARSAQPDCRLAYTGLGLLGLPFLLFDTLTDTGCRW